MKMIPKNGKIASEKIAWQSKHSQRKTVWYTRKDLLLICRHFGHDIYFIPVQKIRFAGLRNSLRRWMRKQRNNRE